MEIEEQDGSSVRDLLDKAFDESPVEELKTDDVAPEEAVAELPVDDPVEQPETIELEPIEAPRSLKSEIKEKWKELPREFQEEWARRESDIERMMTHPSGELHLGRQMKEAITPYMAMITAEGSDPVKATQSLLDTAYKLRTAPPEQKAALIGQIINDYNVDMSLLKTGEPEYQDPVISQLLEKINKLEQQTNPAYLQNILQSQKENDNIMSEINAFASDPANIHFDKVRNYMQTLLANGQAETLKEAYDQACWASPEIRKSLQAETIKASTEQKRKEIEGKRNAAVSVTGSPATPSGNSQGNQEKSLREIISQSYDSVNGGLV